MPSIKRTNLILLLILFCLVSLPIFIHLNWLPIRIWDEARLSINAYEMHKNGNYLVTHYNGKPDMWSVKPPFMIWAQVVSIKLLGVNELAVRLPAALAAFATCLLLLVFSYKAFKNYHPGALAALVLVTSTGYVEIHASRSGDYDVMLGFFTTLYCFALFLYLQKGSLKYLHLFFIALVLGVLTKSVQALLFIPALALYAVLQRKHSAFFNNKWFYVNAFISLLVIGAYYLGRESVNPGYLHSVWINELGGRYLQTLEENQHDFWFYCENFFLYHFAYWLWFIPLGIWAGLKSFDKRYRNFTIYSILLSLTYLLIISASKTKLPWYDVPMFPFLCFMVALALYWVIGWLRKLNFSPALQQALPFLFLLVVFFSPYLFIFKRTYKPSEYDWEKEIYAISYILQQDARNPDAHPNYYIIPLEYNAHILFYVNVLKDQGHQVGFKSLEQVAPGDRVMATEDEAKAYLEAKFEHQLIKQYYNVHIYQIGQEKNAHRLTAGH